MNAVFRRAAGYQGDALNLPVKSVADAVPFYEKRLGFRVIEQRTMPAKTAILERDGVRIGLVENGGDPTQDGSFFEVSSVDLAFEELRGRGLELTAPEIQRSEHGAFRAFFIVAPDGLCYMVGEPVRDLLRVVGFVTHLLPASKTIRIGGMAKSELLAELQRNGIQLNEAGRLLFAHSGFTTAATVSTIATTECSVGDLGFTSGATIDEILRRGARLGLSLCPLELGPHLRLQFLDQPEGALGHPPSRHCAPPGSVTIASAALTDDDDTPKGFYLRNIHGTLWLRGYRSGRAHTWSSADRFVFCDSANVSMNGLASSGADVVGMAESRR